MFVRMSASFIDGIGDEVVISSVVGFTFLTLFLIYIYKKVEWNGTQAPNTDGIVIRERRSWERICPICLSDISFSLETNCGHSYCGVCMQSLLHHSFTGFSALRCPICRQQVSVFFVCFNEEERNAASNADTRNTLYRLVSDYNHRFSGEPRTLTDHLRDLPTLLRHLGTELFLRGDMLPLALRIRIAACAVGGILYILTPLDVIPETIFGLVGLFDDIILIIIIIIYLAALYRRFVVSRRMPDN